MLPVPGEVGRPEYRGPPACAAESGRFALCRQRRPREIFAARPQNRRSKPTPIALCDPCFLTPQSSITLWQELYRRGHQAFAKDAEKTRDLLHIHAIPVGIKPVSLGDGMFVSLQNSLLPSQRANQHQQCRLRQMEIGQQRPHRSELMPWVNENIRFAAAGQHPCPSPSPNTPVSAQWWFRSRPPSDPHPMRG